MFTISWQLLWSSVSFKDGTTIIRIRGYISLMDFNQKENFIWITRSGSIQSGTFELLKGPQRIRVWGFFVAKRSEIDSNEAPVAIKTFRTPSGYFEYSPYESLDLKGLNKNVPGWRNLRTFRHVPSGLVPSTMTIWSGKMEYSEHAERSRSTLSNFSQIQQ